MFRAKSNANYSGWNSSQERPAVEEFHYGWQTKIRVAEHAIDQIVLQDYLETLRHSRREVATKLHGLEVSHGYRIS